MLVCHQTQINFNCIQSYSSSAHASTRAHKHNLRYMIIVIGCLYNLTVLFIILASTMKRQNNRGGQKHKRIDKKEYRGRKRADNDQQQEDFNVEEELEQEQPHVEETRLKRYESAEEAKKRMAREVLSKITNHAQNKIEDDFFVVEEDNEAKKNGAYDQGFSQKLRVQYLRKQNKLYEQCHQKYSTNCFGEPIEYKGHTLCITAFEVTNQNIYSCSKDRSIIKWDRETKQKQFISLGKDINHHRSDILCMSLHSNQNVLATAGDDCTVKLWDTRSLSLIDTLRGHKNTVNGLKFGFNSNNLCSISADLTLKQWDFAQRGLIQTFYEHNGQILDIDCFNGNDFITSGNDHQVISWKTEKQVKVVFKGHDYAIDRVRAINQQRFITACQDGSVYLWHVKKTKPVFKTAVAHHKGWISALDNIKQSNVFATAGVDHVVKIWGIQGDAKGMNLLQQIEVKGIVTDLKLREDFLAVTECDELRLGRWITDKCRNKIKLFPVKKSQQ